MNKRWHCQALNFWVETALKLHSIQRIGNSHSYLVLILGKAAYSKLSKILYCLKKLPAFELQIEPESEAIELAHIKQLVTLTNMEALTLIGITKKQALLGHLSCLTSLQRATLYDSVDTAWLPISLTKLDVAMTVPSSDWTLLSRLQNIKKFTLRNTNNQATRSILPILGKLTALEVLHISDAIQNSAEYRTLGRLNNSRLTRLTLSNYNVISSPALKHIQKMTALKKLEISETAEDDISELTSMTNLAELKLCGCNRESALLLTALSSLTSLTVSSPPSEIQSWLQIIVRLGSLMSLRIVNSKNIHDSDLTTLSNASKSMTALWIHNPIKLTSSASTCLARATNLRSLIWSGGYSKDAYSAVQRNCPLLNIQARKHFCDDEE